MITYSRITNQKELDALQNKSAQYKSLKFSFSEEYLTYLKKSLYTKNACQFAAKDIEKRGIVGYIAAAKTIHAPYITITELFVDPKFQKQGIGTELLQRVFSFAKQHKFPGIITQTEFENAPAQKLYEKVGFQIIENVEWKEGKTYKLNF